MSKLKIGDSVKWEGSWGSGEPKNAIVKGIQITNGGKYGHAVNEVDWSKVYERNVVVSLNNNSWAYAYQISKITKTKKTHEEEIVEKFKKTYMHYMISSHFDDETVEMMIKELADTLTKTKEDEQSK
jgi:hypothetical protein